MRGYRAKDRRASRRAHRSEIIVGFGRLTCEACKSEIVFGAGERPATCSMCGSDIPSEETVKPSSFCRLRNVSQFRADAFLAGRLKSIEESK